MTSWETRYWRVFNVSVRALGLVTLLAGAVFAVWGTMRMVKLDYIRLEEASSLVILPIGLLAAALGAALLRTSTHRPDLGDVSWRSYRERLSMRTSPLIVLSTMALGCSSDSTDPGDAAACTGPVTISVSAGTSPTFSWSPACRLFFVNVESDASDQWGIISDSANAIAPPVQYGVVPAGAEQLSELTPLVSGQTYDVNLFYWTGPDAQDGTFIGSQEFTP